MPKWRKGERLDALRVYATLTGHVVVDGVPVTAPSWRGWPTGVAKRREAIAVEGSGLPGEVIAFDEDQFRDLTAQRLRFRPLMAWSFADRPGLGYLATRQQFFSRSWSPNGPVLPTAIVGPGRGRPNVASTYFAAGYEIFEMPGQPPEHKRSGGGGAGRNDPWSAPTTSEDRMLHDLWERRERRGWWLAEVPVGFSSSPTEASARRIDALVVDVDGSRTSAGAVDLHDLQEIEAPAEVIEAKAHPLRTDVIGQALCGRDMLARSYSRLGPITMTVAVTGADDAAMIWFCSQAGISIEVVPLRP